MDQSLVFETAPDIEELKMVLTSYIMKLSEEEQKELLAMWKGQFDNEPHRFHF